MQLRMIEDVGNRHAAARVRSARKGAHDWTGGARSAALLPGVPHQVTAESWIAAQLRAHEAHHPIRVDAAGECERLSQKRREGIASVVLAAWGRETGTEQRNAVAPDLDGISDANEQVDHDVPRLRPSRELELDWGVAQPRACHGCGHSANVVAGWHSACDVLPRMPLENRGELPGVTRVLAECEGAC